MWALLGRIYVCFMYRPNTGKPANENRWDAIFTREIDNACTNSKWNSPLFICMYFFRTHNFNPLRYNYKNNLPSSSPVVKVIVIVTVFFAAFHVVYMRPNIYLHLYTTKYISAFFTECSTPYDWYKFQSIPSRFTYHIPQCLYTFSRWKHWTIMIRIVLLKHWINHNNCG